MHTSVEHQERLAFIKDYLSTIENAGKFSADQVLVREIANLKRLGFAADDEVAVERVTYVQLFSIEVTEMIRAQMVVVIWSYFENLFASAIRSIAMHKNICVSFKKQKNMSLVCSWKEYFREILDFEPSISEEEWQKLSDILHARNFIAHSTHRPGMPPSGKQMEAVERLTGIRIVPDGISISRDFLVSHLIFAEQILNKLGGEHWLQSEIFALPDV